MQEIKLPTNNPIHGKYKIKKEYINSPCRIRIHTTKNKITFIKKFTPKTK